MAQIQVNTPEEEGLACVKLLSATSNVMFMVLGGRGYHAVRVRAILHSWARCVKHTFVFTDPAANISGYASPRRFVYLSTGDAWRQRPYLPMTHMATVARIMARKETAKVQWFMMVTDRTFVDVRALLRLLPPLDPTSKGYYGQIANMGHKEAFGFHDYVDLNTGVLLSRKLLERITDPEECHDQKSAGGTFDMFDAKLGNCAYFLEALPQSLPGFAEADPPLACKHGDGVGGIVSYGKVEPAQIAQLSSCAGLIADVTRHQVAAAAREEERPQLTLQNMAVHVMARENHLKEVVEACETTWAMAFPLVYYHVDKIVALENGFELSRGRWSLSRNLVSEEMSGRVGGSSSKGGSETEGSSRGKRAEVAAAAAAAAAAYGGGDSASDSASESDGGQPREPPLRRHRIAALNLPERPDAGGEHWKISHDKGLMWNTWLRLKMRAIFEWSSKSNWKELQCVDWHVYVDDDTYVIPDTLLSLLQKYDPEEPHYFGRPLQEEGYPGFVGGGAGIILSRRGAQTINSVAREAYECDPANIKWSERTHQGGDAWLGDCAEFAGLHVDMEYGFYPQPPVADLFHLYADAVAFHGVEDHKVMHAAIHTFRKQNETLRRANHAQTDPRCTPVFVDHKYTCLPHFIIGGVPKAGTTSLYKYLLQHPDVRPAKDKELTFWGNFFTPKRRPNREEVTTQYLDKFPHIDPTEFKVTGEATPGYLYCITCPAYILKYLPRVRLLFTLRNPVVRAYSEYLNKRADRTVMRYLHKRIDNKVTHGRRWEKHGRGGIGAAGSERDLSLHGPRRLAWPSPPLCTHPALTQLAPFPFLFCVSLRPFLPRHIRWIRN